MAHLSFWSSTPIASLLAEAASGFASLRNFSRAGAAALSTCQPSSTSCLFTSASRKRKGVQTQFYDVIFDTLHPASPEQDYS